MTAPAVQPTDLVVRRSDPVYNAHSYLTKVPVAAIVPFIEAFTDPGDTVVDPFAGSGMTGVACAMSGRRAALSDISVLGRHVGLNYVNLVEPGVLAAHASAAVDAARQRLGQDPYVTECSACSSGAALIRSIWSVVLECRACGSPVVFYEAFEENGWSKLGMRCPGCLGPVVSRDARRVGEVAVRDVVACPCTDRQREQPHREGPQVDPDSLGLWYPQTTFSTDSEMFSRSAMRKHGLTDVTTFFSRRNLACLAALWEAIHAMPDQPARRKLSFAFTAVLARASKRYQWSRKRPLNASNQTYYIAPVFFEWNVFDLFRRKVDALTRSDQQIRGASGGHAVEISYRLGSATELAHLDDASVDYVFTDPPFGSNLFYSDMSVFSEAWLNEFTDPSQEAVVHTGRRRADAKARYEALLIDAFLECRRVLKDGSWLSVVFSSSDGAMWAVLQRALVAAGFQPDAEHITVLDKGQRSVKGLASGIEGVVTCDLILSMRKDEQPGSRTGAAVESIDHTLDAVFEEYDASVLVNASRVYTACVRRYLRHGWSLEELSFATVAVALVRCGLSPDPATGLFDGARRAAA